VRLAGCNLHCDFCDTDHRTTLLLSAAQIVMDAATYPVRRVLFTGGEPSLQLDDELLTAFDGWYVAVETNGTLPLLKVNWITCSPKNAPVVLEHVNELRYVLRAGDALPTPTVAADHYPLSPIFDGMRLNADNLTHCIALCKMHPQWRLSVQAHKLWGIP